MMTEIAQKSYKDLFPLWSLKKKGYIEINNTKKKHAEERLKALEKILILKEIKR